MTTAQQVLGWAQSLSHPSSLAFAVYLIVTLLRHQRADVSALQERAEQGIALCSQYGLPDFEAFMTIVRGWAIARQGHGAEGAAQIRAALETLRTRGAEADRPWDLCLLAEACRECGKPDDGVNALNEALSLVEQQENRLYEAEIRRLRGELLLLADRTASAEAMQCFREAIEVAQHQKAKWWELRATTSLARLLSSLGRRDEARTTLAEIYGWFTEGFDTADLTEAKALLDELTS
jgi:predicted ATPase